MVKCKNCGKKISRDERFEDLLTDEDKGFIKKYICGSCYDECYKKLNYEVHIDEDGNRLYINKNNIKERILILNLTMGWNGNYFPELHSYFITKKLEIGLRVFNKFIEELGLKIHKYEVKNIGFYYKIEDEIPNIYYKKFNKNCMNITLKPKDIREMEEKKEEIKNLMNKIKE